MRTVLVLALIAAVGLFAAGCGESDNLEASAEPGTTTEAPATTEATPATEAAPEPAAPSRATITMGAPTEFAMVPEAPTVAAGRVTLDVVNEGAIEHEVVLIRTDGDSGDLPIAADGTAVEDGAVVPHGDGHGGDGSQGDHHAGVHFATGTGGEVIVDLEPGRYAVVCNLPGHYEAGMHANLEVT